MCTTEERPNIRIEIHNNLMEEMEIDDENGMEDGEITDAKDEDDDEQNVLLKSNPLSHRIWPNQRQGFTTGINIFNKEEQEKLQERAKRFGLKPTEIHNFTDEELQELHDSLGITADDEKDIRFNAIHMRGTDNMSTEDVLQYFHKFGPSDIEWINDESCNVLWNDKISAARALFFLSSQIDGMPVEGPCDPFVKDLNAEELEDDVDINGKSVLLRNSEREVELEKEEKENVGDRTHVSDIDVPIPPGYWRLGIKNSKAKFILLRFALKSDKKPFRAERFSEYYKKYGNPNYGGLKGIITESKRLKTKGIFDHNRDMNKEQETIDNKNPWGTLAESWIDEDIETPRDDRNVRQDSSTTAVKVAHSTNVLSRLGFKRPIPDEHAIDKEDENKVEEKKPKIPRMRMYADEEEEKIKRKKQLMALKNLRMQETSEKSKDLRDILRIPKKEPKTEYDDDDEERRGKQIIRNSRVELEEKFARKSKMHADVIETDRRRAKSRIETARFKSERSSSDRRNRNPNKQNLYEEREEIEYDSTKPKSKVAVVIKAQTRPTVASTVWSRINKTFDDRTKTMAETNSRTTRRKSTSSESSNHSSDSERSSISRSDTRSKGVSRPGFRSKSPEHVSILKKETKNPLRIEINNDHFKTE